MPETTNQEKPADQEPPAPKLTPEQQAVADEEAVAKKNAAIATARKGRAEADKAEADAQFTAGETARKGKAEADKAEADALAAQFPAGETKPREGKLEVGESVGLIGDLIAHSLLGDAAEQMRDEVKGCLNGTDRVLIVDSPDLVGSDWPYKAVASQLDDQLTALKEVDGYLSEDEEKVVEVETAGIKGRFITPAVVTAKAASSLIGSAVDLAAMFRADYNWTSRSVTIGAAPLQAAIAKRLVDVVGTVNVDRLGLLEESHLFDDFAEARLLRLRIERVSTQLKQAEVAPSDRELERAKQARADWVAAAKDKDADPNGVAAIKAEMERLETELDRKGATARAKVAVAEAAIGRFDAFATAVTTAPASGYPPLVAAAVRERLHTKAKRERYSHVLFATVESAGGENLSRRGFWKSTVRFLGGAQVSYMLWKVADEELCRANTISVLGQMGVDVSEGTEEPLRRIEIGS